MFAKIGLVLAALALVLNVVSVAIPYWFYLSYSRAGVAGTVNFGLWKACGGYISSQGTVSKCSWVDGKGSKVPVPSEFKAARGLEILAILVIKGAGILACVKIFWRKENKRLLYIAAVTALVAGLFMITGAIVFVADNTYKKILDSDLSSSMKPHAGFALCIVSGGLSLAAGVLFFVAARWIPGQRF